MSAWNQFTLYFGFEEKFFDISLRGTPADWQTHWFAEVIAAHTNVKFSQENKLCTVPRKKLAHKYKRGCRMSVFPIETTGGVPATHFTVKAAVMSYARMTFYSLCYFCFSTVYN